MAEVLKRREATVAGKGTDDEEFGERGSGIVFATKCEETNTYTMSVCSFVPLSPSENALMSASTSAMMVQFFCGSSSDEIDGSQRRTQPDFGCVSRH